MKVTKSRDFTVNMGNFESMRFGATVEIDNTEYKDYTEEDLFSQADKLLIQALTADIVKASELTGVPDSFIHTIEADINA